MGGCELGRHWPVHAAGVGVIWAGLGMAGEAFAVVAPVQSCPEVVLVEVAGVRSIPSMQFRFGGEAFDRMLKKLADEKLRYKLVLRPVESIEKHGGIVESNPHFKDDVKVCRGHEIKFYVGVFPFLEMPELVGSESFEINERLNEVITEYCQRVDAKGQFDACKVRFEPEWRCVGNAGTAHKEVPQRGGKVVAQVPEAGALLPFDFVAGVGFPEGGKTLRGYPKHKPPAAEYSVLRPTLFVDCRATPEVPESPQGAGSRRCSSYDCASEGISLPGAVVVAGVGAGIGYLLRRPRSPSPLPVPPASQVSSRQRQVLVRGRPDVP